MIEKQGVRLLVDPGSWSEDLSELKNIDALFLSHEHQDHTDLEKIKGLVQNNPTMKIYTNSGVGKGLTENKINWTEFSSGIIQVKDISVEAVGEKHAPIYPGYAKSDIPNTGFIFADKLYYPGDSFALPNRPIEILALPICAPWAKLAETVDFAKAVKPSQYFPVHDRMLKFPGSYYKNADALLSPDGIRLVAVENNVPFTV